MNKKNLSVVSLVVGCLSAIVGIFYIVQTIQQITNYNFDNSAKANFYIIFSSVLFLLAAVGFGFGAIFLIKKFLNKNDEGALVSCPMLVYFLYEALINFVTMCFFTFNSGKAWVMVILGLIGAILALVSLFGSVDSKIKIYILICTSILGFALSIVGLSYAGGVSVATYVFTMLLFIAIAAYYILICVMQEQGNTNSLSADK